MVGVTCARSYAHMLLFHVCGTVYHHLVVWRIWLIVFRWMEIFCQLLVLGNAKRGVQTHIIVLQHLNILVLDLCVFISHTAGWPALPSRSAAAMAHM